MTFMTMNVRIYPESQIPSDLEQLAVKSTKIADLDHLARVSGPYHNCVWATARGLVNYASDNCWIFIAMSGHDLAAFNQERLRGQADLSFLDRYPDDTLYVLETEEY
jgi:hypothetical protein